MSFNKRKLPGLGLQRRVRPRVEPEPQSDIEISSASEPPSEEEVDDSASEDEEDEESLPSASDDSEAVRLTSHFEENGD